MSSLGLLTAALVPAALSLLAAAMRMPLPLARLLCLRALLTRVLLVTSRSVSAAVAAALAALRPSWRAVPLVRAPSAARSPLRLVLVPAVAALCALLVALLSLARAVRSRWLVAQVPPAAVVA